MDTAVDLRGLSTQEPVLEATVTLSQPQSRLRVRLPADHAGRADAVFGERVWGAKHFWQEPDGITVYEFDEPLPAGQVTLRIPAA